MNLSNIITAILTDPDVLKPIVEAVRKELAADEPPASSFYQRVVALEQARVADDTLWKRVVALEQAVARLTTDDWEIAANQIEGLDQFIRDQLEQDGVRAEDIRDLDRLVKAEVDNIEIWAEDIAGMEQAIKDALEDITFKLTVD